MLNPSLLTIYAVVLWLFWATIVAAVAYELVRRAFRREALALAAAVALMLAVLAGPARTSAVSGVADLRIGLGLLAHASMRSGAGQ